MIFDIFVGMMLLLNFAGVVLTLSAVGHLLDRVRNAASSQAVLTVDMAKVILDTIRKEFEDRNFQYDYLADCASRCTYALTQDPDFKPLDSAESVAKFADDTFATFDAMHPGFKSYWDNPATEEAAKAFKIPMPHSQPQSVFDGAPFGAASSRGPFKGENYECEIR